MRQIITLEKEIAFKTMVGEITSISLEPELEFINESEIEGNLTISGTYKMTEASAIEEEFSYKIPVEIMLTNSLEKEKRKIDINNFTYQIVNEEALEVKIEVLIEGLEKIDIEELETDNDEDKEIIKQEDEVIPTNILKEEVRDSGNEVMSTNISLEKNEEIEVLKTEEDKTDDTLLSLNDITKQEQPTIKEDNNTNEVIKTEDIEENDNNKEVIDSIFSAFANTDETYATYSVYILREDDNVDEVISKYKTTREDLAEYNDLDSLKIGTKLIIPTTITKEANE